MRDLVAEVHLSTGNLVILDGIRVLIVEDDTLVAATLSDAVEEAGGEIAGVAQNVTEARQMIRMVPFDPAVLDLHLTDGEVTPVLEALHARRARHPELVALRKPILPGRIVAEILRTRRKGRNYCIASLQPGRGAGCCRRAVDRP